MAPSSPLPSRRARWIAAAAAAALLLVALRLAATRTESVNWDEFALLHRAVQSERSGSLQAGGRPGLGVVALVPLVRECDDEIAVVRRARAIWVFVTLAFVGGFATLLASAMAGAPGRWPAAALGVGLLALPPTFVQWSLQVRTDQPALAAALWGGVALLGSRRRPGLAVVAGALLAAAWLFSQKAAYAAALVAVLAVLAQLRARDFDPRRAALRVGLAVLGAAGVLGAWHAVLPQFYRPPAPLTLERGLDVFDFYRRVLGWRDYQAMLPTLLPHGVLLAMLVVVSCGWRARREPETWAAAAALALGAAIAGFHGGRFFYFWMTLGLFPAAAVALGWERIRDAIRAPRAWRLAVAALWAALALPALAQQALLHRDTQAQQRASLGFVARNFSPADAGFQPENALFCRDTGPAFPTFFSEEIQRRFGGKQAAREIERVQEEFQARPVRFLVGSWRLGLFPEPLQRFWHDHYQPYWPSVWVAGRRVSGRAGQAQELLVLASGEYRWLPAVPRGGERPVARVAIDGAELSPGATLRLAAGTHRVEFRDDVERGMLVLALGDPPHPVRGDFYPGATNALLGRY